eukprot:TRINITY_DN116720_c0_g1_i1.p1 TRINITY_DN116720_c0_g1~~TRINITY_DN116720_c0_g1_i1.p1  ORF type:complete len:229 (-),score=39.76 TRINITY_DN116720_c0_g1_i1:37-723(-)
MAGDGDFDQVFNILVCGDLGVGKSSMLLRFCEGTFKDNIGTTIGVDFLTKPIEVEGQAIKIVLKDTGGDERFRQLETNFYEGLHGVILCYDSTQRSTFEHLWKWQMEVKKYVHNKGVPMMLVATKCDQPASQQVSRKEAEEYANGKMDGACQVNFMSVRETSSKTGHGVNQIFEELSAKILSTPSLRRPPKPNSPRRKGNSEKTGEEASGFSFFGFSAGPCCWRRSSG